MSERIPVARHRIRSAIFLDFDNVFSGLLDLQPAAALAFAQQPQEWLGRLATAATDEGERSYLVRRCYMNPAGSRHHASLGPERVFFSRYRPFFTKAGFEVIDCPSLTNRHKNAADIRICLDVMDTLSRETCYDEYVIASGDSDFTPLLQRLRAADRRIVIVASSQTAIAYESVSDLLVNEQQVVELMTGVPEGAEHVTAAGLARDGDAVTSAVSVASTATLAEFREFLEAAVAGSDKPIRLAALALHARRTLGAVGDHSGWFGHRTLIKAIQALAIPGIAASGHYVWAEGRHEAPETAGAQPNPQLPELIARISTLADLPRLEAAEWPRVFESLADYAAHYDFDMSDCTRWTRDDLAVRGFEVGRQAVSFIVWGARYGGCPVEREPAPTAVELATAFVGNTVKRAATAGLHLSEGEVRTLRDWIHPEIPDEALREIGSTR